MLLVHSLSWGADFQKGFTAYNQGDYATAIKEWRPLAERGDVNAQFNLAILYEDEKGDYKTAAKWYTLAAEQGFEYAQYNLGVMYEFGEGVILDYKTAAKWYTLAAEQGNGRAQNSLGLFSSEGKGVIQDNIYAHMWYNIAASSEESINAAENRTKIEKEMTPADISKAQELARQCVNKNYKDC